MSPEGSGSGDPGPGGSRAGGLGGRAPDCLIVAGPTCSGKSALALALAMRLGGTVINADSMQVYAGLHILTARPDPGDEALAPHRLYGVRSPAEPGNVAWWREAALSAMEAAWAAGRLPILCGGTGLYLRALTDGLSAIDDPGDAARAEARAMLAGIGSAAMHARLAEVDPDSAARLRPSDGQRVARAWEVWRGTGRGMAEWASVPGLPAAPYRFTAIRLAPPRPVLRAAIAARFDAMLERGAMEEVRALLALDLSPELPAMRAHGVPELSAVLRGECDLADATRRAVSSQARYTKRQATWFAHHPLAKTRRTVILEKRMAGIQQEIERFADKLIPFVRSDVDAPGVFA
ncbi:tRNA (adenosine(37)-N6)-dimethylallyltransferase MiaA [Endosaccharibacter trunci]